MHPSFDPTIHYQVFHWGYPNWGWYFLGVISGFIIGLTYCALCGRGK